MFEIKFVIILYVIINTYQEDLPNVESEQRRIRSYNVLMAGLPENCTANLTELVLNIFHSAGFGIIPQNIVDVHRIGNYKSEPPRVIRISFSNNFLSRKILRNFRILNNSTGYHFYADKTKREREAYKAATAELQRRRENGEKNISIKFVNGEPIIAHDPVFDTAENTSLSEGLKK